MNTIYISNSQVPLTWLACDTNTNYVQISKYEMSLLCFNYNTKTEVTTSKFCTSVPILNFSPYLECSQWPNVITCRAVNVILNLFFKYLYQNNTWSAVWSQLIFALIHKHSATHMYHSVWGYPEQCSPFTDRLQFCGNVLSCIQWLQFWEGALEGSTMFSNKLTACLQVLQPSC